MRSDLAAATVRHTGEKMDKDAAGYKHGTKEEHCGVCEHFEAKKHECTIVAGRIFGAMWCRYFEKAK